MTRVSFLTLDEVLALHADQIERYGGSPGIRDLGLLSSALAMPEASLDEAFLHETLPEMAAAYLFHLVRNHPVVDGNERTGLVAAIAFLAINDLDVTAVPDALFDLVIGVARGAVTKAEVAVFLKRNTRPRA